MITDPVMIIISERNWGKEAQEIPYTGNPIQFFYNIQLFSDKDVLANQKKDWSPLLFDHHLQVERRKLQVKITTYMIKEESHKIMEEV